MLVRESFHDFLSSIPNKIKSAYTSKTINISNALATHNKTVNLITAVTDIQNKTTNLR